MKKLDYLVACAKIMCLHKSVYKNEDFEKIKNEISALDKDNEVLSKIEDALTPAPAPVVNVKPVSQTLITNALSMSSPAVVVPDIVKKAYRTTSFAGLRKLMDENYDEDDKITVIPIPYGVPICLQWSISNPIATINYNDNSVDVTEAVNVIDGAKGLKYGTFYGVVTMKQKFWDGSTSSLLIDSDGNEVYEAPVKTILNALMKPDDAISKLALKNCEIYIIDAGSTLTGFSSSRSALIDTISTKVDPTSNIDVITAETYKSKDFNEVELADLMEVCSGLYFVESFVIMLDSNSDRAANRSNGFPTDFYISMICNEPAFTVDATVSSVKYKVNYHGEITAVVKLADGIFFNTYIKEVSVKDPEILKEWDMSKGSTIRITAFEDYDGNIVSEIGNNPIPAEKPHLENCPFCNEPLTFTQSAAVCKNQNCKATNIKKIRMFLICVGVDLKAFDTKLIEDLYDAGINTPYLVMEANYMKLTASANALRKGSVYKLFLELDKANRAQIPPEAYFLGSGCFRGVSKATLGKEVTKILRNRNESFIPGVDLLSTKIMLDNFENWLKINPFRIAGWE